MLYGQNPAIVKNVAGTIEFPFDAPNFLWRVNTWNGLVFYQGTGTPAKLCVTDGSNAGTKFIKDVSTSDESIIEYFPAQDFMYIIVRKVIYNPPNNQITTSIWRSDGTTLGTSLVYTMPVSTSFSFVTTLYSNSITHKNYAISGNLMYFAGADQATTGVELWRTDGTTAGTHLVKDIMPGTGASYPAGFCKIGSEVFFSAAPIGFDRKLFKTDGTAAGTVQVPVAEPFIVQNVDVGFVNNKMILYGTTDYTDNEPYVSDGTAAGTFRLADINAGAAGSNPAYLPAMQFANTSKYCFFIAKNASNHNLWRTDGTTAGTIKLTPDSLNTQTYATGNAYDTNDSLIYFTNTQATLYTSDGSYAGTRKVRSDLYYPDFTKIYKNAAWFRSSSGGANPNLEAWRSDGTAANTNQAFDIFPGAYLTYPFSGGPRNFFVLNNRLYFFGYASTVQNLYCYNGDFTFNGLTTGGRWSDSTNWNSGMPPGITDTVFINPGTPNPVNINGARAYAGVLQVAAGATVNLAAATDSLIVNNKFLSGAGTSLTGPGALVARNASGQQVNLLASGNLPLSNLTIFSPTNLSSGNLFINASLQLRNGNLDINNNNISLSGLTSSASGSATAYVNTNGTGKLIYEQLGLGGRTGSVQYPIGTNNSYNPVGLSNAGVADNFGVSVIPNVYGNYTGETPGTAQYGNGVVNRTWLISESTPGGSLANLELQWHATDELPGFDRSQAFISHYEAGTWDQSALIPATGSNPYMLARAGVTSFSPFSVQNLAAVLPLKFITLDGRVLNKNKNVINWTVAGEDSTTIYTVQRSIDGSKFNNIGQVVAGGNSSATGSYLFTDADASSEIYYYRIAGHSTSGGTFYSSILRLRKTKKQESLNLFPNPVHTKTNLMLSPEMLKENLVVNILDASGRMVFQQRIPANSQQVILLDLSHLATAVYYLHVKGENIDAASTLIKQ